MRTWTEERLGLLGLGYRRVVWIHVNCAEHGLYRVGLSSEQEFYLCPVCQLACSASILCEGFTRRPLPFQPQLLVKPISEKTRLALLVEEKIVKPRRIADWHHKQKIRRASAAL
jgi:hypothetical protein